MKRLPKADRADERAHALIGRYEMLAVSRGDGTGYVSAQLARVDGQRLMAMAKAIPTHVRIINGPALERRTVYYGRAKDVPAWTLVPNSSGYALHWFTGVR